MADLRELLSQAVARHGSKTAVSRALCGDKTLRTQISRVLGGYDCGDMDKFERTVRRHFERRTCPHTGREIDNEECRRRATAPQPFGGIAREKHWATCQVCQHKGN